MRPFSAAALGATLLILAASLGPVTPAAAQSRVPTVTRLVKQFIGLEDELSNAIRAGNREAIGRLLAEDFEQRDAARPGEPLPRVDWLQRDAKSSSAFTDIEQMAVHEHGDVLIVSFLGKDPHKRSQFVVDVWQRQQDSARLLTRYLSPAAAESPAREPVIKKKY